MKKIVIPILAIIVICLNVTAQEKSNKELKGDKFAFRYSYEKAIDSYTHTKILSVEGQRKLAEAYYALKQNIQSEEAYAKLITMSGGNMPEDYYNYAMALRSNGKYTESGAWMEKFKQLKPEDLRAKDYAANSATLPNLLKSDGKYKVFHQNSNTNAYDFGTAYYKDKIVFSSSRSSKMFPKKYNMTGKPFLNLYVSEVKDGQMKSPESFDKNINGNMHDGPACFSNDGNFMAFTRNNYHDKSDDRIVELQIWFSNYIKGKWSNPEPFVLNKPEYSVGHPCLTADGKTMYFTSNMPGGYGGTDIYRITKDEKGEWGKSENLGNKINTEGDEMFPFFEEKSKQLYFSSNGRFGLGGLDIFVSRMNVNEFDNPKNAGTPLNTQYDDYAAIVNQTMSKGYFSSNREGGSGNDDIYSFDISKVKEAVPADVLFSVNAPRNIPVERRIRETFPLRNYIFFTPASTTISNRYVLLKKEQVKEFKEDQLEVFSPKENSGRSKRQLTVYYNVINILGDRMGKNTSSSVKLAGASMEGIDDGLAMAESVKKYLVEIFGIDAKRIITEGRIKPRIPSEQPGGKLELDLLREGDRRVTILSTSPALLMEFQSGPDAPLKPVEIKGVEEAPVESYVSFQVKDSNATLSSWRLKIVDKNEKVRYFGPYVLEDVSIPGKVLLGTESEGDYKVTMIGLTQKGDSILKDTTVHMVLWTPSKAEELTRFSIIYEFNNSKSIDIYDKYLTEIVCPKIPQGGTVIIHGYTDIIGLEGYNQKLSMARANDVKRIIDKALAKKARKDVKFEVRGFGEDTSLSPFENTYPEERFYNRTVIIDILPAK
ncbi:MAG: PD40 domain-containing protein [Bacteroidetes bacterium]|nr:PD40 domain-containing protein [Bacteroidota bacterium]